MSYTDLKNNRNDVVLPAEEMENRAEHLRLPPREISDHFSKTVNYLPVTKRCCPACHDYIKHMSRKQGREVFFPGDHPAWSETTIPPWMLKNAADSIMGEAQFELERRIAEIINRQEFDDSPEARSTGSGAGYTAKRDDEVFDALSYGDFDNEPARSLSYISNVGSSPKQ